MEKLLILSIVICLIFVGCGGGEIQQSPPSPEPAPTPISIPDKPPPSPEIEPAPILTPKPPPPEETQPQIIKEWSGKGIKTTEPFTINSEPWQIIWEHEPEMIDGQSMGLLQIMVYKTSNPDLPITLAANSMEGDSDTSYVYETGEFYLTINAANTNWSVKVLAK